MLNQIVLTGEDGVRSVDHMKCCEQYRNDTGHVKKKQEQWDKKTNTMNHQSTSHIHEEKCGKKEYDCKKCGYKHKARECPAFNKQCKSCGLIGYFKIGCKKGKNSNSSSFKTHNKIEEVFLIDTIISKDKGDWKKVVIINNEVVNFKLDSGADLNVIPYEMLSKLNINERKISDCNIKVQAFGGFSLIVKGKVKVQCEIDGMKELIDFVIIDNKKIKPILGRNTCEQLKLIQRIDSVDTQNERKKQFIQNNKCIFEGLGKLPFKYKITLKDNVTPVVRPPRRISFKINEKLKCTLNSLEGKKNDKPTEWVSNLVITEKKMEL